MQLQNTGQWSTDRRSAVYLINVPFVCFPGKASHHDPEGTLRETFMTHVELLHTSSGWSCVLWRVCRLFAPLLRLERVSLVAQMVKRLPTMQETQDRSLGREDFLEKEKATPSSILAWENPMD